MRFLLLLLLQQVWQVWGYVAGDGTTLVFWDSQKKVIPLANTTDPANYDLSFTQVPNFDAFTVQTFTATLTLKPAFFTWMCPDLCGGLSATDYLAMAANVTSPADCTTIWYNGAMTARGDIPSTDMKKRCMFWHVNIHSCPAVDPDGKAAFCTPYIGKTTAGGVTLATHSPAQIMRGSYVGANIVQTVTFTSEIKSVESDSADYTTIAHFKFGVSPNSVSLAAGWAHKINSFSYKTQCPAGFVPNPDGTCGVCTAGTRANPPDLDGVTPGKTNTASDSTTNVDAGTWTTSEYSQTHFCVSCPRGRFSPVKVPTSSMAADSCDLCPYGKYQDGLGSTACVDCPVGHYADNLGQDVCFPCPFGQYQPTVGQTTCLMSPDGSYVDQRAQVAVKACPHSTMTTQGEGRTNINQCVCPSGMYMQLTDVSAATGTACLACPDGFTCAGGTVLKDDGARRHKLPVLNAGFYATAEKPYEAYDCRSETRCPGGNEPAWDYASTVSPVCTANARDINCARCDDGYFLMNQRSECTKCGGVQYLLFFLLLIAAAAAFVGIYIIANSPLTIEMSPLLSASISLGVCLSMLQSLGMIASLSLSWPSPVKEIMGVLKVLVFDLEAFGADCVTGDSPVLKLFGKQLMPIAIIGGYYLMYHTGRGEKEKCINSAGMICSGLFAAFALAAFSPFTCYSGPNGISVMQSMPSVKCDFASGEYIGLFIIGLITFFAYIVGGFRYILKAIWGAPLRSLDDAFIKSHRFLFFRFRPDRYYWMPCLLVRNTALALPACIFNVPQAQALAVILILVSALAGQLYHWPWRSKELNNYDAFSVFIIVLILCFWFPTAPSVSGSSAPYSIMACMFLFGMFAGTGFLFLKIVLKMRQSVENAKMGRPAAFEMKEHTANELCKELMCKLMKGFRELDDEKRWRRRCERLLLEFTKYDMYQALDTFSCLALLMADASERVRIMKGEGEFRVYRILFRMPEIDVVRASQRHAQESGPLTGPLTTAKPAAGGPAAKHEMPASPPQSPKEKKEEDFPSAGVPVQDPVDVLVEDKEKVDANETSL